MAQQAKDAAGKAKKIAEKESEQLRPEILRLQTVLESGTGDSQESTVLVRRAVSQLKVACSI